MSNNKNNPPPWSDAPEWANWRAMDESGEWWWYEEEPQIHFDNDSYDNPTMPPMREQYKWKDWKSTLEKRPDNE